MSINLVKKLYVQRYKPKNVEAVILLPRIKQELLDEDGNIVLNGNYLFSGSSGIGKSSLASVIIPSGALVVNASINSSVEDLKETVLDFCRTGDIFDQSSIGGYKIVYLDEFDGVSQKYQEALRAFIEEHQDRIRFIATCNDLSKISPAMLSRFTVIKFDPETPQEVEYLKQEYFERCDLIRQTNNLNIDDNQLTNLINTNFPDLRSVIKTLQRVEKVGGYSKQINASVNVDLYNILFGNIDTEKTYSWVIENFGDSVENLLKLCGRPLIEYIFENESKYSDRVPQIIKITSNHISQLSNCLDPLVLALSCIFEIQTIIKK